MPQFFFTFGLSDKFPFRGGWVEVVAPDMKKAIATYRASYPDVTEGIINCSDIYTKEQFMKTAMVHDNLGAVCHEVLFYAP